MEQGKLGYIDAARGIAILMVVLVHQAQAVEKIAALDAASALIAGYGRMGVQLFFVASAMTLCMSQSRRPNDSARNFYLRRLFRIAPLYYAGIALYMAVQWLRYGEAGAYTLGNVLANLTFVHGFVPSAINDVVPGGWSIGGEMAFYAVFPFAFMGAESVNRRWGALPIAFAAALGFALYVAAWHVIPAFTPYRVSPGNIFFYWAPAHVVVFGIGMAAFYLTRDGRSLPLWLDLGGFIIPTAIALALWNSGYVAVFAIIPGVSAVSFAFLIRLLARLPDRPSLLNRIGQVSYSMYVLHFLAAWFLAPPLISAALSVVPYPGLVLALTYPLTVAAAFLAALLTERLIEKPGIALGRRLARRPRTGPAVA